MGNPTDWKALDFIYEYTEKSLHHRAHRDHRDLENDYEKQCPLSR
jgi:hypothetical protein